MKKAAGLIVDGAPVSVIIDAWETFLSASGTFYSALEQGSKASKKSKHWFDLEKHKRRTDPLLKYLHHARNAEEHGLRGITKITNSNVLLKPGASAEVSSDGKQLYVRAIEGEVEFPGDRIAIIRVHNDKFNNHCDPPDTHLEKNIDDRSPKGVATLAIIYFEKMLEAAQKLLD